MSVPGKLVKNGVYEFSYMRPPDTRTKCQIIQDAFYNKEEGTIFGHTKYEWGRTGLFYLVFLTTLAAFFAICMKGLLATLNEDKPRWILDSSIIGSSPGLGIRPLSADVNDADEMFISYDSKNQTEINLWVQRINLFLSNWATLIPLKRNIFGIDYHNSSLLPNDGRNQQICSYESLPMPGKVCMFDVDNLGPCSYGKGYGYASSKPCIFLKLNKIIDWMPNYYNDPKELPDNMPQSLKSHIQNAAGSMKNIWVSCQPLNRDKNNTFTEDVRYYPQLQGLPGYYYPYENQLGYLSPLVAIQFLNFRKNEIIDVECQAWAKNIKVGDSADEKAYRVRFSIKITV